MTEHPQPPVPPFSDEAITALRLAIDQALHGLRELRTRDKDVDRAVDQAYITVLTQFMATVGPTAKELARQAGAAPTGPVAQCRAQLRAAFDQLAAATVDLDAVMALFVQARTALFHLEPDGRVGH